MPVKYTNVNEQKLFKFSTRVLEKVGIPTEDAAIAARLMVNTDLRGIASHGVAHLGPLYVKGIKEGTINFKPNIKIWSGAPAIAVIDGDRGLGFVVAYRAMQEAMARAKVTGIGAVAVRNTTHFGACSAYSLLAVKENMIGFASTTGGRKAAAPGASGPVIGMNAMSYAVTFRQRISILSGYGHNYCCKWESRDSFEDRAKASIGLDNRPGREFNYRSKRGDDEEGRHGIAWRNAGIGNI